MDPNYKTLDHRGSSETEIKKSVFIGNASPVTTEEEALAFVAEIKKKYSDAKHNVYAYLLRQNSIMRYSDDHEPQGSAGLPVLDVIRKGGLTDTAIVVTRYFGGTLLGVGGLVRAYTDAAADAVADAHPVEIMLSATGMLTCNYSDYQKLSPILELHRAFTVDTSFDADVTLSLAFPYTDTSAFERKLTDETAGRATFVSLPPEYRKW